MGRRKTHSRDELLAKAMQVFREKGFAGTSAEMLVDQIGVSRYSLYADFGNMQGLFNAALARYNEEIIDARFGPLERPDAGLPEIAALLDFYGSAGTGPAMGQGCLLCNTAVEFGAVDPTGSGAVQRYFDRLSGAFRNALDNARKRGHLPDSVDTRKEADLLTSVVLGLFVLIRAKAPSETIENAASAAKERVETMAA
jgi:AcrR family transcriptional regulator